MQMLPTGPIAKHPRAGLWSKETRMHLCVLGCTVVLTLLLRMRPEWVLSLPLACIMRQFLHLNCPFCGMTRDFIAILHGHKPELNPFSWVAAGIIYLGYPVSFAVLWLRGRLDLFYAPIVSRAIACSLVVMFVVNNF